MFFEIAVTIIIALAGVYILYKNIRNVSSGKCNCSDCSSHCANYKK